MKRSKRYIGFVLLLVYIFFFASANLHPHVHIINGITIVHSHISKDVNPFTSTKAKHNHNSSQINLIYNLNSAIFFILFSAIILGILSLKPIAKIDFYKKIPLNKSYFLSPSLRAPPVF